jgi:hypothetical protein
VHDAISRLADAQAELAQAVGAQGQGEGIDAESRMRLRSIDVQLLRILEEISAGRQESVEQLRQELNALTQAVAGRGKPAPVRLHFGAPIQKTDPNDTGSGG